MRIATFAAAHAATLVGISAEIVTSLVATRLAPRLALRAVPARLVMVAIALLLSGCGARGDPQTQGLLLIDSAHATIGILGRETHAPLEKTISLPFDWDKTMGGKDGSASLTLTFPRQGPADAPMALMARIGNAFDIQLNDAEVQRAGRAGDRHMDTGREYRLVVLPAALLREHNTIRLTLQAQGGRHAGVTQIIAGPVEPVRARFQAEYRYRTYGSLIVATISIMLGLLGMLLWLRQRERLYLVYAAGELLWALQLMDGMLEFSPLPWPWSGALAHAAYAMAPALICKFVLMVIERHRGAVRVALNAFMMLSAPVALMITAARMPWLWPVWQIVLVSLILWVSTLVVYHGIRSPSLERRVLAIAVMVTAAAALRDLVLIRLIPGNFGVVPWSRYCWVLFGVTLGWIVAEQLRKATMAVRTHNDTLSERLAEREAELRLSFQKRIDAERREAVSEERLRMTRDMHDGLGSQLTSALHLAKNPAVPRDVLADQLTEALDHLKLTVDAMQDIEGDIASLLGALRYRISPRLAAANIRLDWIVEALPPVAGWTVHQSRDLQLILYEALSNVLQHSGADRVELSARWHPVPPDMPGMDDMAGTIEITLLDNGRGFAGGDAMQAGDGTAGAVGDAAGAAPAVSFPAVRTAGNGIGNMQLRARRLGADFSLISSGDGTELRIVLPALGKP